MSGVRTGRAQLGESLPGGLMRFLANENFPLAAVKALRAASHDAVWVRDVAEGMSDPDVPAWAVRDGRILLTFDKDFGELAGRSRLPVDSGVLLFRVPMPRPGDVGKRLFAIINGRSDWAGHFAVIEPGRVRMRKLQPGG